MKNSIRLESSKDHRDRWLKYIDGPMGRATDVWFLEFSRYVFGLRSKRESNPVSSSLLVAIFGLYDISFWPHVAPIANVSKFYCTEYFFPLPNVCLCVDDDRRERALERYLMNLELYWILNFFPSPLPERNIFLFDFLHRHFVQIICFFFFRYFIAPYSRTDHTETSIQF